MLLLLVQAFAVQSYVTGEGPYANWSKHVADPFGYNLVTIVGNEDRCAWAAGLPVMLLGFGRACQAAPSCAAFALCHPTDILAVSVCRLPTL